MLTQIFVFTPKATNSSAGSQDQDDPDFFEAYPLPTQEVSAWACGFGGTLEVKYNRCVNM